MDWQVATSGRSVDVWTTSARVITRCVRIVAGHVDFELESSLQSEAPAAFVTLCYIWKIQKILQMHKSCAVKKRSVHYLNADGQLIKSCKALSYQTRYCLSLTVVVLLSRKYFAFKYISSFQKIYPIFVTICSLTWERIYGIKVKKNHFQRIII